MKITQALFAALACSVTGSWAAPASKGSGKGAGGSAAIRSRRDNHKDDIAIEKWFGMEHIYQTAKLYTERDCNGLASAALDMNIGNEKCYYDQSAAQSIWPTDAGPGDYCLYMYDLDAGGRCDCIVDHRVFTIEKDVKACFPYPLGHKAISFEKMPAEGCWKGGCYYTGGLIKAGLEHMTKIDPIIDP